MNGEIIWIACGVVFVLLVVFLFTSYVKAPPAVAYIISGISKAPRVLIGKGGIRVPFFERLDKVYLGQVTVDIKTERPVPTNDFINVDVDAVAKVRILPTEDGIRLAAKNFLNMEPDEISEQLKDSLQGNMREIIGTLDLRSLNTNRDGFSDQITSKASPDMNKLGIEIISCNIQNVSDKKGLIEDLGADNTFKIKKDAAITKAQAERDIAIESSKANKEANDVRVEAETAIAEKNNTLALKVADLKRVEDERRAIADAAYVIQQQEQQKVINSKTVEAQIEQTRKEQTLSEEQIKIKENELASQVRKQAEADKYDIEQRAAAALEQRKRTAEAEAYEAEQKAKAIKAQADAKKYEMLQEAEGIKAKGEAEAYAIQQQGIAEAEAMDRKAEAYKKYNNAAILEMMVGILPDMAGKISESIGAIDKVTIYGGNADGVSQVSGQMPLLAKQTIDLMTDATGVDMRGLIRANSIEAKTDRNVDFKNGVQIINETKQKAKKKDE